VFIVDVMLAIVKVLYLMPHETTPTMNVLNFYSTAGVRHRHGTCRVCWSNQFSVFSSTLFFWTNW